MKKYLVYFFLFVAVSLFGEDDGYKFNYQYSEELVTQSNIRNYTGKKLRLFIASYDLNETIFEPSGYTNGDITRLRSAIQLGETNTGVGSDATKNPQIVTLSNGQNAQILYGDTQFAIDVIYFTRKIQFFVDDHFYEIFLHANDYSEDIIAENPEYFEKNEIGQYQWKSRNAADEFIVDWTNGEIPGILKDLDSEFERILKSINTECKYGTMNDSRVRIRTLPNLESDTIGHLESGDIVRIIDYTSSSERIQGMNTPWYLIENSGGKIGWVYGYFIDFQ